MNSNRKIALIAVAVIAAIVMITATSVYVEAQVNNGRGVGSGVNASCQCQYLPLHLAFKWGKELGFGKVGRVIAPFKMPNIVISDEYREAVLRVLQRDENTSKLLSEGYELTAVKPIFKVYVDGDGTVAIKASEAIAVLTYKSDSKVSTVYAYVDLVQGKVMKLITFEKNVSTPAKMTTSTPGTST